LNPREANSAIKMAPPGGMNRISPGTSQASRVEWCAAYSQFQRNASNYAENYEIA